MTSSLTELISAPRAIPWVFAAKTTASGLIALLIAFAFDLDQPSWSLLTVFIVAQPQSGLVLAKGFFRIIGTLVGAAVALFLISLFAQERVLFLGALALWLALCTYASKTARNFTAYGFVLAGYTAAIVGVPGAQHADGAFFTAVARVTEISIGILSTAVVSRLVLPLSLGDALRRAVIAAPTQLCDYVATLVRGDDTRLSRATLLNQIIAVDNQRASAVFEDPDIRARSAALRGHGMAALALVNVSHLLQQSLALLRSDRDVEIGRKLKENLSKAVSDVELWRSGALNSTGLRRCFQESCVSLPLERDLHRAPVDSSQGDTSEAAIAIGRVHEFFEAFASYADAHEAVLSREAPAKQRASFSISLDQTAALSAGLRSAIAVGAISAFWILADWPNGVTALTIGCAMTAALSIGDSPYRVAIAAVLVMTIAAFPSFIVVEILLPRAAGFPMFALIVGPVLFCCGYLMGRKKTAGMGFLAATMFSSSAAFHDRMTYNPVAFVNTAIAIIFGAAVTALLFSTIAPDSSAATHRRFIRAARKAVARIGGSSSIDLSEFEAVLVAALNRVSQAVQSGQSEHAATFDAGIAALGIGRELILLKERGRPTASGLAVQRVLLRFVSRGDAKTFDQAAQAARDGVAACLVDLRAGDLGVSDAQAASRELMAFRAIEDGLPRSRPLFDTEAVPAGRGHVG